MNNPGAGKGDAPADGRDDARPSPFLETILAGEHLGLGGSGACWYPAASALMVADLHLGKAAAFRSAGLPVPDGHGARDLSLLEHLLGETGARRLVVAGDVLHAPTGITPQVDDDILAFRGRLRDVEITVTVGNHDRTLDRHATRWGMEISPSLNLGPFRVVHSPDDLPGGRPSIVGHLHPAMRWSRPGHGSLRCRCFWWRANLQQLVLPSFGSFTGNANIKPALEDQVFPALGPGPALRA